MTVTQVNQSDPPPNVAATRNQSRPWYRSHYLWAGLGFAVLTLAFSWRMWGSLSTAMPGGDIDGFENVWNDWWVRKSLLDLHTNPFFTSYLYYPLGISLRLHTLQPLNGLLTILLAPLFGPVASTNLTLVGALWGTGFFSYLLFYYLTRQPLAAFVGGVIFGFCNYQQYEFWSAGQTNLISLEWLPLYALFMLKAGRGERLVWGNIAAATGLLFCLTLTDLQYLLFALLLTGLYGLYLLVGRQTWTEKGWAIGRLALVGAVYSLVAVPLIIIPAFVEITQSPWLWPTQDQSLSKANGLWDYLGWGGRNLGYLPLALAGLGLVMGWRKANNIVRWWFGVAVFFGLLSFGPELLLKTQPIKLFGHHLPMPYAWLSQLPGMKVGRNPSLYAVMWMLAAAALAAYGIAWLLERWPGISQLQVRLLMAVGLGVALLPLLPSASMAYQLNSFDVSPFYEQLAQDHDNYSILEVPSFTYLGRGEDVYQSYQVIHNKWRFGGRLARDHKLDNPNNFIKNNTFFREFYWLGDGPTDTWHPAKDFLSDPNYKEVALPLLNFYKVRYIVLYKAALSPQTSQTAQKLLAQVFGQTPQPTYDDAQLTAYRVPQAAQPAPNGGIFLDVGDGWHKAESQHEDTWRWASNNDQADIYLYNLSSTTQEVQLSLKAYSFKVARDLNLKFNNQPLASTQLEEAHQPLSYHLKLAPGQNVLSLSTPQPGRAVADYGFLHDARVLSFAAMDVQIEKLPSSNQ